MLLKGTFSWYCTMIFKKVFLNVLTLVSESAQCKATVALVIKLITI